MDFGYGKCNGYECYNDRTVFTETEDIGQSQVT